MSFIKSRLFHSPIRSTFESPWTYLQLYLRGMVDVQDMVTHSQALELYLIVLIKLGRS